MSVCEVYHNDETNGLEISMKLFVDDLELAIQKSHDPDFRLLDMDLEKVDQDKIGDYIKSHFKLKIDTKTIELDFLGCELMKMPCCAIWKLDV